MASFPIAQLADTFTDNTIGPLWLSAYVPTGSATRAETGGQARFTLPSSTAGTHEAGYQTTGSYDLTGDELTLNVDTMVSTSVAATAILTLFKNGSPTFDFVRIAQLSGTLSFQKAVGGVITTLASVSWSATTHKYWRIRESGGTIFFDTSTSASAGASWTNRASVTIAASMPVTSVLVRISASCGNVASPGSFRLEEIGQVYPAPSATWRFTTADWGYTDRRGSVTLASDGGKQGVLVTADTMDSSRVLGGTVRYFAAPLGSSSGGYLQLTEYASLAAAQANPFLVPVNGRVDFPAALDSRLVRLYHRSIDASNHNIYEFMPRRLVQADDIEAESIQAINIAAGAITADKIFVLALSAITESVGQLTLTNPTGAAAWLYQGTGTGDSPTTGLKIFNSGGIGKLSTYNATVEQVTLDTDGALKAGAGQTYLDDTGANIIANTAFSTRDAYKFVDTAGGTVRANWAVYNPAGGPYSLFQLNSAAGKASAMEFRSTGASGFASYIALNAQSSASNTTAFSVSADSTGSYLAKLTGQSAAQTELRIEGRMNVGSSLTGKGDGQVAASAGFLPPRSGGSAVYAMDTTVIGSAISLANNATATPFSNANVFGGMILINETLTFGAVGLFLTGGGLMNEISDPSAKYSTTSGTASSINVYMVGSVVTIENKTGSSISLNVCGFRNRTGN